MSDGGFATSLLMMQLGRQFRMQQTGVQRDYGVLSQDNAQLVADYNEIVADYNNLLKTANRNQEAATRDRQEAATRIAELERQLTEAEASAEHWRYKWADLMSKKANS